jgi:hypothetical protein
MYFKQVREIVRRTKTQTRRTVKVGEFLIDGAVFSKSGRLKWCIGRDYAVSPGRGKHGLICNPRTGETAPGDVGRAGFVPLRIKIDHIKSQRLHDMTESDALAEGIARSGYGFIASVDGYEFGRKYKSPIFAYANLWDSINKKPGTRWEDNPTVWVIHFSVAIE